MEYGLEKVDSLNDIVAMGVMSTPALAVDDEALASGRLLSPGETEGLLKNRL